MLRKLLATSAMATLLATGAIAQEANTPAATEAAPAATETGSMAAEPATAPAGHSAASFDYITALSAGQHLSDDMVGADVMMEGATDQQAGEIQNLVVSADGTVLAAVLRTGDALGDESRDVAVPFDKFAWSMNENDEPTATLTATVDEISAAPTFTSNEDTAAATTGTMAPAGGTATTPAPAGEMAATPAPAGEMAATPAPAGDMAATPAPDSTMGTPATTTADTGMGGEYLATLAADQYLADDLVGDSVYTGPTNDSDNIGNINNLVINEDGTIAGLIVGVGGFLGIGEKNVGVPFDAVALTNNEEGEQHASLVVTREDLDAAPAFDNDASEDMAAAPAATETSPAGTTGGTMAAGTGMAAGTAAGTGMAAAPAETDATTTASTGGTSRPADLTPVAGAELTADNLIGTTVYGPDDSSIGSIGDIALTAEGQVDAVIVDVGGFLGIGAKPVAVAMDNLQFMRDSGGSMYLTTDFTQDELEAAPEYNRDTYADSRDTMRIESGATAQ
jgi:sporulation protein YlmC with PRC-barrel domain